MSARSCCRRAVPRRVIPRTAGGTLSAILLVAMPKCPVCLAAYVSVATGVGIGFTTAKYLRLGLIVICVAALIWMVAPLWRRVIFEKHK